MNNIRAGDYGEGEVCECNLKGWVATRQQEGEGKALAG